MSNNGSAKDKFVSDIIRGLVYSHNRANANTAQLHETSAELHAVVELLVEGGVVDREMLEERSKEAADQLRERYISQGMAVAMQEFGVSKYEFQGGAEVDCKNLIHLCKAACCRIPLALSKEDVQEGIVQWDFGQPYIIARDSDGYCVHLNRKTWSCRIYDNRPIPCRGYDCRKDKRIWTEFGNKVLNPRIAAPDWLTCLETEAMTIAGKTVRSDSYKESG